MSKVQRNTDDFLITPTERLYQNHLNQMTGADKLSQSQSLWRGIWEMLVHQIYQEKGNLSERDLHYHLAKKIYINDKSYLNIIEKAYHGA